MALGKGLGAILDEVGKAYELEMNNDGSLTSHSNASHVEEIDVESISPNPYQPRKHFDENTLKELSDSILKHGLLQPIVVLKKDDGYLLIAGERRLRAHKLGGIPTIKAIIADVDIDSIRLRELALIENIQRENLNAIELANSYAELIDVHSITHEELSAIVHKSRSQITNTMRLLSLDKYAQTKLIEGEISQGHAKILVGIDSKEQKLIIDTIIGQKLSVREAEQLVKKIKVASDEQQPSPPIRREDYSWVMKLAKELESHLHFEHKFKKNKLEITFNSKEELMQFIQIAKEHR